MDYVELMREAIDYIEDNLFDKINHNKIADNLFISEYHFWRIFYAITNYTIKEYVEKRRLSTVLDLIENTDRKLIDIAFDCGYNSPEVFSRAFKKNFGISPSTFRRNPIEIERFTKLDLVERKLLNYKAKLFVDFKKFDVPKVTLYGKRFKVHDYSIESGKIRQLKWNFGMKFLPEIPDLKYYILSLERSDLSLDAEYFLGFEGLSEVEGFEEFVIQPHTCISIDYVRGFESVNDLTEFTIRNDVYQVVAHKNYMINDFGVRAIEVYTLDYAESGRFEMRIPIIEE